MPEAFGERVGAPREGDLSAGSRLVISGGHVALCDDNFTVLSNGAVAIEGGRVEAVGSAPDIEASYGGCETIDASGKLVMPGLINAHTHLYSALARGLMANIDPSANFAEILEHLWWRLDRALTIDDMRLSAAAGSIDLMRNGTTTIIDHHASQVHIDGSLDAVAEPLEEAGLRFESLLRDHRPRRRDRAGSGSGRERAVRPEGRRARRFLG